MLIHNKDDIEFVTEFPCFLGHSVYSNFLVLLSTTVFSQNINKQIVNIADENLPGYSLLTILNERIIYKDDIEFVTEFPCLLGHPV